MPDGNDRDRAEELADEGQPAATEDFANGERSGEEQFERAAFAIFSERMRSGGGHAHEKCGVQRDEAEENLLPRARGGYDQREENDEHQERHEAGGADL